MPNPEKLFKQDDYISRYQAFPYYYDQKNNKYYRGLTSFLRDDVSYVIYEVKSGDSYDSIALDFYGCALFFWVITDFNRIMDSLSAPVPGQKLKLPSLNSIVFSSTGG